MGVSFPGLSTPNFVNDADGLDPNLILADMITAFQQASGRTLQPAQVERLLINLYAYRESLVRNAIQWAGQQNLLAFASFPMIDYLGQLLGVERLAAVGAVTTLEFTLSEALSLQYVVAANTLVGTSDGQYQFTTSAELIIPAGTLSGTVNATCTTPGSGANGYLAGQVSVLLNPSAQIASVSNTTTTSGGSEPETDDHLRSRIQAAPNQFSVAGPANAYRYFALSADQSIIDAQVISPGPGSVNVYVLCGPVTAQPATAPNNTGIAGASLLAEVEAALSTDSVRPLCDTVSVLAVNEVDYQITGTVTLYADADPASTMAAVNTAAQQLALELAARIQRDIVPEEIIAALGSVAGVYRVQLTAPSYTQLTSGQWANCTETTLSQAISTEHS